ncbi:MAG: hypothetical protein ACEPOV_02390 [Hyphomicrobiales bacterium]
MALDRTNWKFGKLEINIFMLSCCCKGISIPTVRQLLPKAGNSNKQERIALLNKYIKLFGKESISVLLADMEFIGKQWLEYLTYYRIPFCIRIKNK